MAELLIVVAIIAVLSGVGFIAVQRYDRSMAQLERDSIAKEIFVAAQNHLTMADSQGYPGVTSYGTAGTMTGVDTKPNIYYFDASGFTADGTSALDLMLPFGSVDETVRGGGSYIIRYQRNPATVLDVFYCVPSGKYSYDLSAGNYEKAMALRGNDKKASRRDSSDFNNAVIGWYGGGEGLETGRTIKPPVIEVENADRLIVRIKDLNSDLNTSINAEEETASLKLIITGTKSKAQGAIALHVTPPAAVLNGGRYPEPVADSGVVIPNNYTVTLDDITQSGMRFADLVADTKALAGPDFIPGEDIIVQAVAYSKTTLTNIAYSAEITTNSLFADLIVPEPTVTYPDGFTSEEDSAVDPGNTVVVTSIRHLENLDKAVSSFAQSDLDVQAASQANALAWDAFQNSFVAEGDEAVSIYYDAGEATLAHTQTGSFKPVDLDDPLAYNGNGNAIQRIVVNYDGNAGVFGTVGAADEDKVGSAISNLEIIDCSITSTSGSAGALAGSLTGVEVKNVLAHNSTAGTAVNVTAANGGAGGLIGTLSAFTVGSGDGAVIYGTADQCAAALTVSGKDAGGLIGAVTGEATVKVNHSYAGGHTQNGDYYEDNSDGTLKTDAAGKKIPILNVSATDNAGGLVGSAGGATIENSYSTCSATGKVVGGLVGEASGKIDNCYATGLVRCTTDKDGAKVDGAQEGAFAGSYTGSSATGLYYEIINERLDDTANPYLPPIGDAAGTGVAVTALDANAGTYNAFVGNPETDWKDAVAYDAAKLKELFGEGKYPLKTVDQLKTIEGGTTGLFIATHYGDWPAPETLVVNTKSTT